jgi:hypothetical protein
VHQALAVLSAYSVWRHLALKPLLPRLYVYIFALTFLSILLLECSAVIYRNVSLVRGCTRVFLTNVNDVVKIRMELPRPLHVDAGEYICLCIPGIRFSSFSFLQSHPIMVTSWSEEKQHSLDLFVEPRGGLTRELLRRSKPGENGRSPCVAFFSGPHGTSAPVGDYETILMITDGSGIFAHSAYLKKLIYGYNSCKTRTRRIHLVWQLQTFGKHSSDRIVEEI